MRIYHLTFTSLLIRTARCVSSCPGNDTFIPVIREDVESSGSSLLQSRQRRLSKVNISQAIGAHNEAKHRTDLEDGIAVIVPGLGNRTRVPTVQRNIQWLKTQGVPFECWVYVYRTEKDFPLDTSSLAPCKVVRHAGFWLSHMLAWPLEKTKMRWVLHMEDGTEPQSNVNLKQIFKIMVKNGLGHAAPTFDPLLETNPFCCTGIYPLLARQETAKVGRFVDFIEFHFDVLSREYFSCLQSHIDPSGDDDMMIGWGMDKLLPALCGGAVSGSEVEAGRIGLLDQMTIRKRHFGSYTYEHGQRGLELFLGRHLYTPMPTMQTLGELQDPSEEQDQISGESAAPIQEQDSGVY